MSFMANNESLLRLNPKIYGLDIVYKACYVLLDRAFFLLDGDPEKEILIYITPKDSSISAGLIKNELQDELINYLDHKVRFQDTKNLREIILSKAMGLCSNENNPTKQ